MDVRIGVRMDVHMDVRMDVPMELCKDVRKDVRGTFIGIMSLYMLLNVPLHAPTWPWWHCMSVQQDVFVRTHCQCFQLTISKFVHASTATTQAPTGVVTQNLTSRSQNLMGETWGLMAMMIQGHDYNPTSAAINENQTTITHAPD